MFWLQTLLMDNNLVTGLLVAIRWWTEIIRGFMVGVKCHVDAMFLSTLKIEKKKIICFKTWHLMPTILLPMIFIHHLMTTNRLVTKLL